MSWPRWHIYLILPLRAVPKLLPSTTHVAVQFSVNSSADQPAASAGLPSPRWALHPHFWAAHSETAELWYLMVHPANTLHGQVRDMQKKTPKLEQLSSLQGKNCKTCPIFFFSNTQRSNGSSRDMVGQDTAYAQVGLMDWQSAVSV